MLRFAGDFCFEGAQRSAAVSKVSWKCRVACSAFQSQHRYIALAVKDFPQEPPILCLISANLLFGDILEIFRGI